MNRLSASQQIAWDRAKKFVLEHQKEYLAGGIVPGYSDAMEFLKKTKAVNIDHEAMKARQQAIKAYIEQEKKVVCCPCNTCGAPGTHTLPTSSEPSSPVEHFCNKHFQPQGCCGACGIVLNASWDIATRPGGDLCRPCGKKHDEEEESDEDEEESEEESEEEEECFQCPCCKKEYVGEEADDRVYIPSKCKCGNDDPECLDCGYDVCPDCEDACLERESISVA